MEQIIIALLFFTSLVGVAFIVERGMALRWRRVVPRAVETAVDQ